MARRVILVTGGNRGIGLAIVQSLAQRSSTDTLIMTSRTQAAIDSAISDLRAQGVTNPLDGALLEVTDDASIAAAVKTITDRYGRLDVLVNNAGYARIPSADASIEEHRSAFADVYSANVTSVFAVTRAFMPLLRKSESSNKSAVINISSGRASLSRSANGQLPATASVAYSVSKTALNALTVELQKSFADVSFYVANPGHCKTAFNGYRGVRDPREGAEVVVALIHGDAAGKSGFEFGFYETKGDSGVVESIPW